MLVQTFPDRCESGLYPLKYQLFGHVIEDIRRFQTPSVLDSGPYDYFNFLVKQAYERPWQRRLKRMMETVNIMEKLQVGAIIRKEGG